MIVKIAKTAFNPWQALQHHQDSLPNSGQYGAASIFVGTVRDFNQGDSVLEMCLEYYPGMTERQLEAIVAEACQQWRVLSCLVIHRVGVLLPNDTVVLVAVWAAHRGEAFDACRYIMETLKSRAPFWKKEQLASGQARWVAGHSPIEERLPVP